MIKHYNNISLAIGVPGLLLQTVAAFYEWPASEQVVGTLLVLAGTAMLLVGLAFYAKAKNQHPVWCLFGLLSIIGVIVLAVLRNKSKMRTPQPV